MNCIYRNNYTNICLRRFFDSNSLDTMCLRPRYTKGMLIYKMYLYTKEMLICIYISCLLNIVHALISLGLYGIMCPMFKKYLFIRNISILKTKCFQPSQAKKSAQGLNNNVMNNQMINITLRFKIP